MCGISSQCSASSSCFLQAEDGIRDIGVTGVQTCALPIYPSIVCRGRRGDKPREARRCATWWCWVEAWPACGPRRRRQARVLVSSCSTATPSPDWESVVEGKGVDLGGRRIIKQKKETRERK